MRHLLLAVIILFSTASVGFAQVDSDSFTVNVNITNIVDVLPPSTPTLLSAVPISVNQIDLAWSSSTDDFAVSGYTVSRDSVVIATTSLLSFADTGLVASTTYNYSVRAFDAAFNYSSSSNNIATTTPDVVTTVPAGGDSSAEGTAARVVLDTIDIATGFSTSTINLQTPRPSRIEIRWGRSTAYELGYVVGSVFRKEHTFPLSDLEPGTIYEYQIIGYTAQGIASVLQTGSFTTLSDVSRLAPLNVTQFRAIENGSNVVLSWKIPAVADFAHVRVVRSHLGFPEHPVDGAVLYQGSGERVVDIAILDVYSPAYYTAFVYDTFGNVSSGAIAMAYLADDARVPAESGNLNEGVIPPTITNEATSTIDQQRVTPTMKMPTLEEIIVTQNSRQFTLLDAPIYLDSSQPFIISVPKGAVAGNLKSIIATVLNPTDTRESYSFLLRINKDQSAYVTAVAPLEIRGKSQLQIEIYDYEAFVVATYQTPIEFISTQKTATKASRFSAEFLFGAFVVIGAISIFSIFFWLFVFWRRWGEDKTDEE